MYWFIFFLLSLAVARVTWFLAEDHLPLVAKPRQWIVDRSPEGNLAYLVQCWWCVGVYVAAGASAFAVWALDYQLGAVADWKTFLLLWPALAMTGVTLMLVADVLMEHGTDD